MKQPILLLAIAIHLVGQSFGCQAGLDPDTNNNYIQGIQNVQVASQIRGQICNRGDELCNKTATAILVSRLTLAKNFFAPVVDAYNDYLRTEVRDPLVCSPAVVTCNCRDIDSRWSSIDLAQGSYDAFWADFLVSTNPVSCRIAAENLLSASLRLYCGVADLINYYSFCDVVCSVSSCSCSTGAVTTTTTVPVTATVTSATTTTEVQTTTVAVSTTTTVATTTTEIVSKTENFTRTSTTIVGTTTTVCRPTPTTPTRCCFRPDAIGRLLNIHGVVPRRA